MKRAILAGGLVLLVWMLASPGQAQVAPAQAGLPLYTVSPDDNLLRSVDPLTGETLSSRPITVGGLTVLRATGLARHPNTGQLYALVTLAGQRTSELVALDAGSGAATRIGNIGDEFVGLAFTESGKLLAVTADTAATPRTLFALDTARATATPAEKLRGSGALTLSPEPGAAATPWRGDFSLRAEANGDLLLVGIDGTARRLATLDHSVSGLALDGSAPACSPRPALFGAAHQASSSLSLFYSMDATSGAATLIGPIGFDRVTAMDFGPTNTLFAIGQRPDGSQESMLLTIDLCTGRGTAVGPTGLPAGETVADLAYRKSDRTLFAYVEPAHELATVDLTTGALRRVGTILSGDGPGNGIAARADGTLLHAAGATLARLNPPSLTETIAAPLDFPGGGDSIRVTELDFSSQGELFALVEAGAASPDLATVDPFSGEVASLGPTQAGLAALAALAPDPDLILSMADSPDPILVTGNLNYTLTVANAGPEPATGVMLTDTLPMGVNFGSATTSSGTCTQSMGVVTCDLGMIAAQASATATIVAAPQNTGTITNTASVTLIEVDPNLANNTASADTDVVDFMVSVMPASVTVTRGNTAVYTVTVTPIGGRVDVSVTLDCDMEPASTTCTFLPSSVVPGGGPIDATLNLRTTAPSTAANQAPSQPPLYAAWLLAPLGLLVLGAGRRRRARAALGLLLLILVLQAACGGGTDTPMGGSPGTPLGTHTFTVRGIVGSLQRSTTVMVVVQ